MRLSPFRQWLLFALIVTASVLNYVDRQIIAVLKPLIETDLGWTDRDYGTLASLFQLSAAFAYVGAGWIVDRLGVRWANPVGVAAWSLAAMGHAWARSWAQFMAVRLALGATEAMGTPSGIKTIAAIFPPNRRSAGIGFGNAASNCGAIVTPLVVPAIALVWGWRGAFLITGILGFVWAAGWLFATRGLHFDEPRPATPRAASAPSTYVLLRDRRSWTIAVAKLLSDQTWWLLLFWMPDFFHRRFGLGIAELGLPLATVYSCAAIGSMIGGALPARFLDRGGDLDTVRKRALLVSALLVVPMPLALFTSHVWTATAILGLVLAAHQGFSTNIFALIADVVPGARVGRVTAFGALVGNLGGMTILYVAGVLLSAGFGYLPLFLFAATSYPLAFVWVRTMLPDIGRYRTAIAAAEAATPDPALPDGVRGTAYILPTG